MQHDNITLIGMPGAGKSTLGVVLAKKLGFRFCDTDLIIQEGTDKLLSELIAERGIEGFIELENKLVAGLQCEHHIIATGGSVVYGEDAMNNLRSLGRIVFIDIGLDELRTRLRKDLMERGVVIRQGSTLEDLYTERHTLYERYADIVVNTDGLSTLESIEALVAALEDE